LQYKDNIIWGTLREHKKPFVYCGKMLKSGYIYRSMFLEKEGNNIGISIGKEEASGSNPDIGSLTDK